MASKIIDISSRTELTGVDRDHDRDMAKVLWDLRRARRRIAQLEGDLAAANRDNLRFFNRAREAENRLEDLQTKTVTIANR